MRTLLLAAALALLVAGQAMANPCTGTNITNCNAGSDDNINNVSNKAYGGDADQSQKQHQKQSQSQSQSQSSYNANLNTNQANNAGNNQSVSFSDQKQAPGGFGSNVYASGPCTGAGAGGGFSVPGFGLSFGATVLEGQCQEREFARIALASNDPALHAMGVAVMQHIYSELMGGSSSKTTQTSSLPAATMEQVAEAPAAKPDSCKYAGITSAWYQGHCQ